MRCAGAVSDVGESRFDIRRGVVDWDCKASLVVRERNGVAELIVKDDDHDVGGSAEG